MQVQQSKRVFKIFEKDKNTTETGLYEYSSVIINPSEIKQMDDFLTEENYTYIKKIYVLINENELIDAISKRLPAESDENNFYYSTYSEYCKSKAKSTKEAQEIFTLNKKLNFYEILSQKWIENNVYELRSKTLELRGKVLTTGNLLQQYLSDKAFKEANFKYITQQL